MTRHPQDIDRELGSLLRLHRIASGYSSDKLSKDARIPKNQLDAKELGTSSLTVSELILVSSALNFEPRDFLTQLKERSLLEDKTDAKSTALTHDLLASNRGRQAIYAMANCDDPKLADALLDLIIATCVAGRTKQCTTDARSEKEISRKQ